MTYRALLIGNSIFDADASLNPLNAPVKDVARLHRALVDADTGVFDDEQVRLVTERTCDDILDELDRFFAAGRRDDLLLLYYSGHGVLDEHNRLYLYGRDSRSDRLLRTAVSNVRVNEFVAQSMAQRIVIVLDCCSSGMFKGGPVGTQLAGPGRYVISSTRGTDLANDAATATGTSLFTEHLVEGMLGAAADANGDGYIDLREIYDYVRDRLLATTTQVPHCRFDGDAAVSLARVRVPPAIARAPDPRAARSAEPTFALAENTVTLRDIEPDEQLRPEVVEVLQLGDAQLDLVASTDADWLTATVSANEVCIVLRPRVGSNRAKITIRDRASGSTQVLRIEARVRAETATSVARLARPAQPEPLAQSVSMAPPEPLIQSASMAPPEPLARSASMAPAEPLARSVSMAPPEPLAQSAPRPHPIRDLDLPGLGVAGVGAVLLLVAFSGIGWYRISGKNAGVGTMHKDAANHNAHLAYAFFGWLGWLLVAAAIVGSVLACLYTGRMRRLLLGPAALVLGVVGIGLTLAALQDLVDRAREQGYSVSVWLYNESGLYLALLGFALTGVAATLRPAWQLTRRLAAHTSQR